MYRLIGIGAIVLAVKLEPVFEGLQIPIFKIEMSPMDKKDHLCVDRGVVQNVLLTEFDKVRTGCPCKIMDILLIMSVCFCSTSIIGFSSPHSGCTKNIFFGHGQVYFKDTEVCEKLGIVVVLMTVPLSIFEYADLGKPLRDHEKIIMKACPARGFRQL